MAEVTALRNNLPYPVYGVPFGIVFPILDADGDPVAGAADLDSEVSLNGDTAADCTNEATQIATSTGMYYLLLTAAEMTANVVSVIVKTSTVGAKTTPIVLYPRVLVTLAAGTAQGGDTAYITLAAGTVTYDDQFNGCFCTAVIDTVVESRVITDCTASNQQCTVTPAWNTAPDNNDTYIIYLPEGMQVPTANVIRVTGTAQTAADVGAIAVDWVNGGRLDLLLDTAAAAMTTQLADAIAAHEARPTPAQALLMIYLLLTEKSVSTTTVTVNKVDGTTSAFTLTLDDATNPTSITRTT